MARPSRKPPPTLQEVGAEIVRRVRDANANGGGYVIRLSDPPTLSERFELFAARLERRPIAIMPHKCATMDEWAARYGWLKDR